MNWPRTDWIHKIQKRRYDYPFGGEKDRHPDESGLRDDDIPALERSVESWSAGDVRLVMLSTAYRRPGSPDHELARTKVQGWFKRTYGDAPASVDATGRMIDAGPSIWSTAGAGGGPVHVNAHSREGGKVPVSAYDRSPPSR